MTTPTTVLRTTVEAAGLGTVVDVDLREDGAVAVAGVVRLEDGTTRFAKALPDAPAGLFDAEADGLRALAGLGAPTPSVHLVRRDLLVLDAMDPCPAGDDAGGAVANRDGPTTHRRGAPVGTAGDGRSFWHRLGQVVGDLHLRTGSPRHGWHRDNWLGRLRQDNTWHDDGHEFFARRRLLRWLDHPVVDAGLDTGDRRALATLCDRLPEVVADQPAVLTHGNLWRGNVVADPDDGPVLVDPSLSLTWADVDLAMVSWSGPPVLAAAFLDGYRDVTAPPDGWHGRRSVVLLNEWLCQLAHDRGEWDVLGEIRTALDPFRRRVGRPR